MQFYKERNFGALISDTFQFFKEYGRNYFKNFFLINGVVLLMLILVITLGYGELIQQAMGANTEGQSYYFEQYFSQNMDILIGITILFIILFILLIVISYTFPVLYMKRKAKMIKNEPIENAHLINDLKENWQKILIYSLGVIFILFPMSIVILLITTGLMFLLIGFILIFFVIPVILNIFNLTLFNYLNTEDGYFKSIKYAFNKQFSRDNFFKYCGSNLVILIIIQATGFIFTTIPMLAMLGISVTSQSGTGEGTESIMQIVIIVVYVVSILVNLILMNFVYVNAGFIYYDSNKDFHKDVQLSEIDLIGKK